MHSLLSYVYTFVIFVEGMLFMVQDPIIEEIKSAIEKNDVVLYMKGSPDFPQCGFSGTVVGILKKLNVEFKSFDVLQNMSLREGIKKFSDWPTIPQLYIKGEFIGGCDIAKEMYQTGELKTLLESYGLC